MSSETPAPASESVSTQVVPDSARLESGAYEVLRQRLAKAAEALTGQLAALNATRREVFGGIDTQLLGTVHLGTDFNCIPADLTALGQDRFLFGVNAQFGLKDEIQPPDVFQTFALDRSQSPPALTPLPLPEALTDASFQRDFAELYRFYRDTRFAKFHTQGLHLFQIFQTGKSPSDFKAFRFRRPGDGQLGYDGARFDQEIQFPRQHGFDWKRVDPSMSRRGEHPHYSIEDQLFVETVGGDLTLKVEDNTRSGSGIYSEPVTDPDQALEDAEIHYAKVGPLILLKVRPYREDKDRYLLFHRSSQAVHRIDAIGDSCVILPQDHGIIFATGVALMNGEVRLFEHGLSGLRFERQIQASNGEDSLFVFTNPRGGETLLFHYNVVEQSLAAPQHCQGFTLFGDGTLLLFRAEAQPGKLHALQLWQTPFLDETAQAARLARNDHPLAKIGNQALVRGLAELRELLMLAQRDDRFQGLYLELARRARALLQGTWWIDDQTTGLRAPLTQFAEAAEGAVAEFAKVQELRLVAENRLTAVRTSVEKALREAELTRPDDIFGFVGLLNALRHQRGETIALREVRSIDLPAVEALEARLVAGLDQLAQATATFLNRDDALAPYEKRLGENEAELAQVNGSVAANALSKQIDETAAGLELLTEITATLPLEDPQRASQLIERVSGLYARLNQLRAQLQRKRRELTSKEDAAEFAAQISLLSQAAANALERIQELDQVEPQLARLLAKLEQLEGRFAEADEFLEQLAGKREEIFNHFEARKTALLEARNTKAQRLFTSAERILESASRRLSSFQDAAEIHAWFAGDILLDKLRASIAELDQLGDGVKAQQLEGRLKGLRDEALRGLRDRQELYEEGGATLSLGNHKFRVHEGEIELTLVPRQAQPGAPTELALHITGSSFYQPVSDPGLLDFRDCWERSLPSETPQVARAETLAWLWLNQNSALDQSVHLNDTELPYLVEVQAIAQSLPDHGFARGVHDQDAAKLLSVLAPQHLQLGLAAESPMARALADLFWDYAQRAEPALPVVAQLQFAAAAQASFGQQTQPASNQRLRAQLEQALTDFLVQHPLQLPHPAPTDLIPAAVATLLGRQLAHEPITLAVPALEVLQQFQQVLSIGSRNPELQAQLNQLGADPAARLQLLLAWLERALPPERFRADAPVNQTPPLHFLLEAAAAFLAHGDNDAKPQPSPALSFQISGLISDHPALPNGKLEGDYPAWAARLRQFQQHEQPRFAAFQRARHALLQRERAHLRLNELKPEIMGGFVRNRLIDEVYLPLIGANFARQLGAVGEGERAERLGLLLLISPPGYGKTTLIEYLAARLGLALVKISGPALGHEVTSLDPAQAPNAGARREVERLNLGLMMGDNLLLYLDDIQHTNPEFLQKFISLCDAQRKIEGVWNGQPVTHDLRGRRVAVVMAGNPYTESGGKFKIPDMLANRADAWNLGDVSASHRDSFVDSYIENSIAANPILRVLTTRPRADLQAFLRLAQGATPDQVSFETSYAPAEEADIIAVLKHLLVVREVILRVNQAYIESAAQEDRYREEPPFLLQGSYRNMGRIASRILPLLTAPEVDQILQDHYRAESQSLAAGAEASLLKLRTMLGWASGAEQQRWQQILSDFRRGKLLGGGDDDPVTKVVARLNALHEGIGSIAQELSQARQTKGNSFTLSDPSLDQLERIIQRLRTVPVEVNLHLLHQGEQITNIERRTRHEVEPQAEPDPEALNETNSIGRGDES